MNTWLDFGAILIEAFYLCYFFSSKFWMIFFQGQRIDWPYLMNGWFDWNDLERKYIASILGELFDLGLWPHPLPWRISWSNFEIAVSQELFVWLMWNEKEADQLNTGTNKWPWTLTTPKTLTLKFEGRSVKYHYLRNRRGDCHGAKGM